LNYLCTFDDLVFTKWDETKECRKHNHTIIKVLDEKEKNKILKEYEEKEKRT